MKLSTCKTCGLEVAVMSTKKGKRVTCDVYWDGEHKVNTKNHQPVPHSCTGAVRKNKNAKKRF